jgi:alpha-tubulin suppressor-like RCC1 family protein
VRVPSIADWLQDVALRDLVAHERHAACIDARGDVYQWGDGFFGTSDTSERKPTLTLRGKVRFPQWREGYTAPQSLIA